MKYNKTLQDERNQIAKEIKSLRQSHLYIMSKFRQMEREDPPYRKEWASVRSFARQELSYNISQIAL